MNHKILLADGTLSILQIIATAFKTWKVWKIQFSDGREAMLYQCGNEWVQRNEDQLDEFSIIAIGQHIDDFTLSI